MTDAPTTEELRAFVGPNADYYLAVWEPALTGTGPATAGPRWAFFFPLYWLGLRGMSGTALVITALVSAELFGEGLLIAAGVEPGGWETLAAFAVGLTVALVCAVKGNGWYLRYAREEIAHVRTRNLPGQEHLAALAERGGMRGGEMLFVIVTSAVLLLVADAVARHVAGR